MSRNGFKDHFSGHAAEYARSRPGYPPTLFAWLAEQCTERKRAWDCATGNGQAAVALAEHFDAVIATDASRAQIADATPHSRVSYFVAPAEESGIADASCDLVTVAQALHWFELDAFYAEVNRVLKPGGLLAAWTYDLARIAPDVDRIIDMFDTEIVGAYWPPERCHIDNHYEDLAFPFMRIDVPPFEMQQRWSREQFVDYIGTWSAVQRYRQAKHHDPLAWLDNELASCWHREEVREVRWPMYFLAGQSV